MSNQQEQALQALGPEPAARAVAAAKAAEKKAETGKPYRINTTPYYSKLLLAMRISGDQLPVAGTAVYYFAKLEKQTNSAFNYSIGMNMQDPFTGIATKATRADTNLKEPFQTVSDEDLAFEAIALSHCATRVVYSAAPLGLTDPLVIAGFKGEEHLFDPSGGLVAPQIGSPFNLQDNLDQLVRNKITATLIWGGKTNVPLGTCDYLHDSSTKSYLNAAGVPLCANVFKMPEGHNWEGLGSDSQLEIEFSVEKPAIMAITATTLPTAEEPTKPAWIILEYKVTLLGVAFRSLGRNG